MHNHSLTLDWEIHDRVLRYVERAGFLGIHRLVARGGLEINRPLKTALVERWRHETHTFHLTVITLKDVVVIIGLRVHGLPVIGSGEGNWVTVVHELLGIWPTTLENVPKALWGLSLRLTWLWLKFFLLPNFADEETVQRFAWAYILVLMGSILFADKSGDTIEVILS